MSTVDYISDARAESNIYCGDQLYLGLRKLQ